MSHSQQVYWAATVPAIVHATFTATPTMPPKAAPQVQAAAEVHNAIEILHAVVFFAARELALFVSDIDTPLDCNSLTSSGADLYSLIYGIKFTIGIKIKRPAHLSIVKRLGEFW